MPDKTALGISEELRQFIEALVEEVVLEGKSFETPKKYLQRFSEAEGLDFVPLEETLKALFSTAEEIRHHDTALSPAAFPEISGWPKVFIDKLQVAYCRKDLTYLENVLYPKSQIITGAFVQGNEIRYRNQGKQQYLANLRYVFAKNKNIDVTFETDEMTGVLYKSTDGKCQIVRLLQHWTSNNYTDRGYLSLLLSSQDEPQIYLRTWHPIKLE